MKRISIAVHREAHGILAHPRTFAEYAGALFAGLGAFFGIDSWFLAIGVSTGLRTGFAAIVGGWVAWFLAHLCRHLPPGGGKT